MTREDIHEDDCLDLGPPNRPRIVAPTPGQTRAASILRFAEDLCRQETDVSRRADLMRAFIDGLGLDLDQTSNLYQRLRRAFKSGDDAAALAIATCKSKLLHTPIKDRASIASMLEMLESPGDLTAEEQATLKRRLQRFIAAAVAGQPFEPELAFESNGQLHAVEKIEGRAEVGHEYFFEDAQRMYTDSGWARGTVVNAARKSILIRLPNGQEVRVGESIFASKALKPVYRIVATYKKPPEPRYLLVPGSVGSVYFNGPTIVSAVPTDRVVRHDHYLLATGEGASEELRIETLAGADETSLYAAVKADEYVRLPRGKWRIYRITDFIAEDRAPEAMRAAAVAYRPPEPLSSGPRPKREARAPRDVVVAAAALKTGRGRTGARP